MRVRDVCTPRRENVSEKCACDTECVYRMARVRTEQAEHLAANSRDTKRGVSVVSRKSSAQLASNCHNAPRGQPYLKIWEGVQKQDKLNELAECYPEGVSLSAQ